MIKTYLLLLGTLALLPGETPQTGDGNRLAFESYSPSSGHGGTTPAVVLNRSDRNFWFW